MASCTFQPLQRKVKDSIKSISVVRSTVCFTDLNQLDKFMKQINQLCLCATTGCKGALRPVNVRSVRLGGVVSNSYACSGCASQWALFETLSKYELGNTTKKCIAAQLAFIIVGCTRSAETHTRN